MPKIKIYLLIVILFVSYSAPSFVFAQGSLSDPLGISGQTASEGEAPPAVEGVQMQSGGMAYLPAYILGEPAMSFYTRAFQTIAIIAVGYLLVFFIIRIANKKVKDLKARHTFRKNIAYFATFIIMIAVVLIWAHRISSLTIFLGVASAGVALALQEAILCVAGWFLIVFRHPYEVGDRIELDGVKGDVIDIRLFQTGLLEIGNWVGEDQSTGRIANIPNSKVFKSPNFNYTRGFEFIWNEIKIVLTFESDYKRAEELILAHANKMAEGMEQMVKRKIDVMTNKYMIYYDKLTPIVYTKIIDSGVELSLRYLTEAKKRRFTQNMLNRMILDDFEKEPNVNFAYTTYRIVKA